MTELDPAPMVDEFLRPHKWMSYCESGGCLFGPRPQFEQDEAKYPFSPYRRNEIGNGPQPKPAPFIAPAIREAYDAVMRGENAGLTIDVEVFEREGLSEAAINRTTEQ